MADQSTQDKTEQPTEERLRKARKEGNIPESKELPSGIMILAMVLVLAVGGGALGRFLASEMGDGLAVQLRGPLHQEEFAYIFRVATGKGMLAIAPFAVAAMAASIMSSLLVGGWTFAPKRLHLKLTELNPVNGFKNLFSLRGVVELLKSLAKVVLIGWVSWRGLQAHLPELASLPWQSPTEMATVAGRVMVSVLARITVALLILAGVDVLYQRWNYRRKMRMSRQEVKEERRQFEQSPEARSHIRSLQFSLARKRMLQEVPDADVVVVNPTHVAVALRYETGQMNAPVVVAKGGDFLCRKIKDLATQHHVPIVERPELARALYSSAEIGQAIPETLFVAVAEVLAMIYRLQSTRSRPSGGPRQ